MSLLPPIPHRPRRVAWEVGAALVWPAQVLLIVLLPVLPVTAVVVAELERMRSRACGAEGMPFHDAAGGWGRWLRHRIRTRGLWRRDVPVTLASCAIGLVSLVLLALGGIAGGVLLSATALWQLRGIGVMAGPWVVRSTDDAWLMTPVGAALLVLTVWALIVLSLARDAGLRVLSGDEEERLLAELGTVRISRATMLQSFEAERRRIERDLHDGAQQDLVALSITIGMLDHHAAAIPGPEGQRLRELAGRAHAQAEHSLARLRETVHGIHPRELTDHGLFGALEELANRSPLQVDWHGDGDDSTVPSPLAGAIYFVVAEALTNVARHSGVSRCEVAAQVGAQELRVSVRDAGRGGAAAAQDGSSTGLAGLRERTAPSAGN